MEEDYITKGSRRHLSSVIFITYVILIIFLTMNIFQGDSKSEEITETIEYAANSPENNDCYIDDIPLINQLPELPTGCEVTSAAMLLNFYNINVDKIALGNEIPKAPLPSLKNGRIEGDSPNEYFIGVPSEEKSFGVFHKPIHRLISQYIDAEDVTGCDFSQVIEYVKSGRPVMAWITRQMVDVEYEISWFVDENIFWWPKYEHTVVIVGIAENNIIINDPYGGEERIYDINEFKRIWEDMGRQAIVISK